MPVEEQVERMGARVTARWPFINAFAVELPGRRLGQLASLPGVKVVLQNSPVVGQSTQTSTVDTSALANAYNYAVKVDKVWEQGAKGDNVTVAVVDSGITTEAVVSDFGMRMVHSVKMNSTAIYASDRYGHGTHVAGIIGGDGKNSSGKYVGIAPGVNLINVKFSDDAGTAYEQDLISGLQWIYDNRTQFDIKVVNISATVSAAQSYTESATAAAVEQLWFAGIVVVVSAGNLGSDPCAVCHAPASDPYVISVGAIDDAGTRALEDDFLTPWSSRGLTMDNHAKPDVVAPGAHIVSYMPSGDLRTNHKSNIVDSAYFRMGGTSMAAPVVSGVIALMLQVNPHWTPDEVKWILMNTGRSYQDQPAGSPGIVDAAAAAFYAGTPGKANQGLTPSPLIDSTTGTIDYSDAYWSNAYWSNSYWSNSISY